MPHGPHPFTLRQLQYVVAVADTRSFRRAAVLCRVSQPALSTQIAQVEGALGISLFERDRRRVVVTPAGEAFVERARGVLLAADDLVQTAQAVRDPLSGLLRVGVIPTLSPYVVPVATPALSARLPRLSVVWQEDKTPALVHALALGELDAALLALEAELGDVEHAVVAEDPFVLATRPDDPLATDPSPLPVGLLRARAVLVLDDGHCFRDQVLGWCKRAGAQEHSFRATSLPTLAQLVATGQGVTLLPQVAVGTEAARAGLRVRPFQDPAPARTIALVWRVRSPLGPSLRQVAAVIQGAWPHTPPSLPAGG